MAAVFTQFFTILVDGSIYLPFSVVAASQHQAPMHLLKLFCEDAYGFVNEEINRRQEQLFIVQQ